MKTFMWVIFGVVALLVVIGLVNKPSEEDERAKALLHKCRSQLM